MLVTFFWLICLVAAGFNTEGVSSFSMMINDHLSISYPVGIEIDNIFENEGYINNSIQASSVTSKIPKENFKDYKSLAGKFSFSYPSAFSLDQKQFSGSEIIYHIGFSEKNGKAHGFVQVWNLPYSFENFLQKSKNTSLQSYRYFNSSKIRVAGLNGIHWNYSINTQDNRHIKSEEVFLSKSNRMYRISYFAPEEYWDKRQSENFWRIVNSLRIEQP